MEAVEALEPEQLAALGHRRDRSFLQAGITFDTVGADGQAVDRPFPLDLVPRVIEADEWSYIKRGLAQRIGVPTLAGTETPVVERSEAVRIAKEIGFPLIIKAAFGGGGRGLKVARKEEEVAEPGDPENPLGRAQLVYSPPNTIHGTNAPESVGQAVSHGSIRVTNEVAMELAREVMEAGGAGRDEVEVAGGAIATVKTIVAEEK